MAALARALREPSIGARLPHLVAPLLLPLVLAVVRMGLLELIHRPVAIRPLLFLLLVALEPVPRLQEPVLPPK